MTYNITLTANHQSLTAEYLPLAAESVQYLTAKVVCETEDWTGREIKAMFRQGCTVHEVTVTDGEITAKQQLNLSAGDWCVWLVGNSARDGEVIPRITTNIAHISVAPTGGTEGNPFPVIPPTAEEQLRADMGNLADLTTEDKSSLVAAINEAAEGGSKDAVKYTPQTLTEAQQAQARENIGAEKAGTGYTKPAFGIPKSDLAADVQTSLDKADAAISLGLTSATPGQIIKVKAVQDGKPTEWEAVDMASGGDWMELPIIKTMQAAEAVNALAVSEFTINKRGFVAIDMPRVDEDVSSSPVNVYVNGATAGDGYVYYKSYAIFRKIHRVLYLYIWRNPDGAYASAGGAAEKGTPYNNTADMVAYGGQASPPFYFGEAAIQSLRFVATKADVNFPAGTMITIRGE